MTMVTRHISAVLFAAAFSAYSQRASPISSDIQTNGRTSVAEIAAHYTNFTQITKSPVLVNRELAMLCRGISKADIDAARVKFGPHNGAAILIYMNKAAADAFATNAQVFPAGAVIVKQKKIVNFLRNNGNLEPDSAGGVGGMVKRPAGYDPTHGDWEYFYFEDVVKIESGHISSCVQCHDSAKANDYVFGTWNKTGG
jgi:hypothetical protein